MCELKAFTFAFSAPSTKRKITRPRAYSNNDKAMAKRERFQYFCLGLFVYMAMFYGFTESHNYGNYSFLLRFYTLVTVGPMAGQWAPVIS